jgi:hypothetical protein
MEAETKEAAALARGGPRELVQTPSSNVPERRANDRAAQPLPLIVAEWPKNQRGEIVRVSLEVLNDNPIVSTRVFWRDENGEFKPGRSGFAIGASHLPKLSEAFASALAEARRRGLVDEGAP